MGISLPPYGLLTPKGLTIHGLEMTSMIDYIVKHINQMGPNVYHQSIAIVVQNMNTIGLKKLPTWLLLETAKITR